MKKFLLKFLLFIFLLGIIFFIGLLLPCTPRSSESLLFAQLQKDKLLKTIKGKRLILVGGSNLSFGIDSKSLSDSLNLKTINTGVHAQIGLQFMMDHSLPMIQKGDLVIIIPEYNQFYGTFAYGGEELLRTILDVDPTQWQLLNGKQLLNLLPLLPEYSFSKFRQHEYFYHFDKDNVYLKSAFNEYGDVYKHWTQVSVKVKADNPIHGKFNNALVEELVDYKKSIENKGAKLLICFPSYQATSYDINRTFIKEIERNLIQNKFSILGNPERYRFNDSLFFNSTYHLNKQGVNHRTSLLLEDIQSATNK